MSDDITITGRVTLTWDDQFRFLARRLTIGLLKLALVMLPVLGAIWALDMSKQEWLALRTKPLTVLADFATFAWLFYLITLALLAVLMISNSLFAFRKLPRINRQLTYEVSIKGILTKDAADFALMVPWSSIVRMRNTSRRLYLKTAPGGWRYLPWRAFAPEHRGQILRWASREGGEFAGAT